MAQPSRSLPLDLARGDRLVSEMVSTLRDPPRGPGGPLRTPRSGSCVWPGLFDLEPQFGADLPGRRPSPPAYPRALSACPPTPAAPPAPPWGRKPLTTKHLGAWWSRQDGRTTEARRARPQGACRRADRARAHVGVAGPRSASGWRSVPGFAAGRSGVDGGCEDTGILQGLGMVRLLVRLRRGRIRVVDGP